MEHKTIMSHSQDDLLLLLPLHWDAGPPYEGHCWFSTLVRAEVAFGL